MTTGPDQNLWFTASPNGATDMVVGKITLDGTVTEYPVEAREGRANSIASGADGNLWFVEEGANAIGRSSVNGKVTSFPLPGEKSRPTAITAGADGNLWFTEGGTSKVGRITPDGQITEFPLPPGRLPSAITAGADGNLWFTEGGRANRVGRITTSGEIEEFRVPGSSAGLNAIDAGPDGNLWFTEEAAPKVGRVTPKGQVTQFVVPVGGGTSSIVSGPEGKLWFVSHGEFASHDEVGAISTTGVVSWPSCLTAGCLVPVKSLAAGPDGKLWVGADVESCKICGGGSAISLLYRPGRIGSYELPPVKLAVGSRITPVRDGKTSLVVACGLPGGCRGLLRLGYVEHLGAGAERFRVLAEGAYDLKADTSSRVQMRVARPLFHLLRTTSKAYPLYLQARAGPKGQAQAKRGGVLIPR
jgi:streptogramin lyase